jgi:pyruvate/2-oxoglutarate/acetoin dehydrogenase E1 component
MTYREAITQEMTDLGRDPECVIVGYGLQNGKGAMGTLLGVSDAQLIEFTVAEGLMVSAAIGLALAGRKPLVYIERADFIFNAMDAIVNHLDKLAQISRREFRPGVIIRVTIGNKRKPLFTGPTHTNDPTDALATLLRMPVIKVLDAEEVRHAYAIARERQTDGKSTIIFELKDLL